MLVYGSNMESVPGNTVEMVLISLRSIDKEAPVIKSDSYIY